MAAWKVVDTGVQTAQKNMDIDSALLEKLAEEQRPMLHLYEWEGDCATYGHFIDPVHYLNVEAAARLKLSLARRPTGGGIVFHLSDLAFSVLLPASHPACSVNTLENYATINQRVILAIQPWLEPLDSPILLPHEPIAQDHASHHFCMAKPTKYDVMIGMKKIGGAAQRRTRHGILHQGTISLATLPESYLAQVLLPQTQVLEAMKQHTFSLLPKEWSIEDLRSLRSAVRERLVATLTSL